METMTTELLVTILLGSLFLTSQAAMDLPKFRHMVLLYPGYYLHGGRYRDKDIIAMVGTAPGSGTGTDKDTGNFPSRSHNTASLRLSWMLNRCSGQHALGTERVNLSRHGGDSYAGRDGRQYIFRNTAYGPFLAARYGNPLVAKPDARDHRRTMDPFRGKQGIVRLVSYRRAHAAGHVGLWDCDHFVQSRDWTSERHIISVEFWEAPDSYCPPASRSPPPLPKLVHITVSPRLLAGELHQQRLNDRKNWRNQHRHKPYYHGETYGSPTRHQRHHLGHRQEGRHHKDRHAGAKMR